MAPVIRECQKRRLNFFILHTGQHFSPNMDTRFFRDLKLPQPKYNLGIGSQPHRKQVGLMIKAIKRILIDEMPDVVIVQGDTISVLAGALAANKLGIPVAHHESGLRSHDPSMLEETNRVTVDHVSDFLFAPTVDAIKNLKEEGYVSSKIFYSGNTVVDAVLQNLAIAKRHSKILQKLKLKKGGYLLVTAHRAENVDKQERLSGILEGLSLVYEKTKLPIIWPIHPRTQQKIKEFSLLIPRGVKTIAPVGYFDALVLQSNARIVMTDSGGLQEEACTLRVPCVTMRDNTERPETLKACSNVLVGALPERILAGVTKMLNKKAQWKNPFGDGRAAKKIIDTLLINGEI